MRVSALSLATGSLGILWKSTPKLPVSRDFSSLNMAEQELPDFHHLCFGTFKQTISGRQYPVWSDWISSSVVSAHEPNASFHWSGWERLGRISWQTWCPRERRELSSSANHPANTGRTLSRVNLLCANDLTAPDQGLRGLAGVPGPNGVKGDKVRLLRAQFFKTSMLMSILIIHQK